MLWTISKNAVELVMKGNFSFSRSSQTLTQVITRPRHAFIHVLRCKPALRLQFLRNIGGICSGANYFHETLVSLYILFRNFIQNCWIQSVSSQLIRRFIQFSSSSHPDLDRCGPVLASFKSRPARSIYSYIVIDQYIVKMSPFIKVAKCRKCRSVASVEVSLRSKCR